MYETRPSRIDMWSSGRAAFGSLRVVVGLCTRPPAPVVCLYVAGACVPSPLSLMRPMWPQQGRLRPYIYNQNTTTKHVSAV